VNFPALGQRLFERVEARVQVLRESGVEHRVHLRSRFAGRARARHRERDADAVRREHQVALFAGEDPVEVGRERVHRDPHVLRGGGIGARARLA
jgi:hypothetical protein